MMTKFERETYVKAMMETKTHPCENANGQLSIAAVIRRRFPSVSYKDAEEIALDWVAAYAKEFPAYKITRDECREIAKATDWLADGSTGNHVEVYRGESGKIRVYDLVGVGSTIDTQDAYIGSFYRKATVSEVAICLRDEYGCMTPFHLTV